MTERITRWVDVRCGSESGRRADIGGCRKCAITGREQMQQMTRRLRAYSITSSAVASNLSGTVRPSILAV